MNAHSENAAIFALERPSPVLWRLYLLRALCTGPLAVILLPIFYFRYHTLRYRFDEEGVHMRVGLLIRREVNVTFARIQDIHLSSGILQRWLGLADVQIQTASGNASAELVIEGFPQFEQIRDFLYTKMRGARPEQSRTSARTATLPGPGLESAELVDLLRGIRDELRQTRELIESRSTAARDV